MAAPLGAGTTDSPAIAIPDTPAQKPKTGLFVALGLAALAAIGGAVVVMGMNKAEPAAAPVQSVVTVEKIVTVEKPVEVAKPPSTGVTDETAPGASAAPAKVATGGAARPTARGTTGGTAAKKPSGGSEAAPATEAPKKKKKGCNCDPSDFDCAIRCASR
jgi:hypothetical protein